MNCNIDKASFVEIEHLVDGETICEAVLNRPINQVIENVQRSKDVIDNVVDSINNDICNRLIPDLGNPREVLSKASDVDGDCEWIEIIAEVSIIHKGMDIPASDFGEDGDKYIRIATVQELAERGEQTSDFSEGKDSNGDPDGTFSMGTDIDTTDGVVYTGGLANNGIGFISLGDWGMEIYLDKDKRNVGQTFIFANVVFNYADGTFENIDANADKFTLEKVNASAFDNMYNQVVSDHGEHSPAGTGYNFVWDADAVFGDYEEYSKENGQWTLLDIERAGVAPKDASGSRGTANQIMQSQGDGTFLWVTPA